MALLRVDLDAGPGRIVDLLAVDAAVRVAVGLPYTAPTSSGFTWDGPGDGDESVWMGLQLLADGRALVTGWHHEFSLTEGSGRPGEAGTDLVGDAPGWWRRGVEFARSRDAYLGFLYGWDGSGWWRLDQPVDDGFDPELFPVTDHATREIVSELAADTLLDDPDPEAVAMLLAAGARMSEHHLAAVLHSPDGWPEVDTAAGVRAASGFRPAAVG